MTSAPRASLQNTLQGKVALVTGAGAGIGRATATLLATAGANVAALSRGGDDLAGTCAEIRATGVEALEIAADVADAAHVDEACRRIEAAWGRLDIVVANAGINGLWAPVEEIAESEWDRTFAVNLKGTFLTVKHSVPLLKKQGGAVVVISSVNGTRVFSTAGASAYASSKAGQAAFAKMIALELAPAGIRVNVVCPGSTATRIGESTKHQHLEHIRPAVIYPNGPIPLTGHRIGSAEQVAELVWFLVSPYASHITGAEIFIDGGESLLRG
ncbi:MAG TPA: SDR family NAD(P)-dependent oxidoreductase [Opitutaceae bacterium]|nr:SDR family NAD(P)-dependent oxidoreductase [Opitutaceae bacterium]